MPNFHLHFLEILSMWITDLFKKKKKKKEKILQRYEGENKGSKVFALRCDMGCPFHCFKVEM